MTVANEDDGTPARLLRGLTAGVVAGVLASFAMDRFQAVIGPPGSGGGPPSEPATSKAADAVSEVLDGRTVASRDQQLAGQMVHFALGTALGAAYGVAAEFRPQVSAGFGTAFGLTAAVVLDESLVPAFGLGSAPWRTKPAVHLYTLTSHLVFGVTAEFTRRQVRSTLVPSSAANPVAGRS